MANNVLGLAVSVLSLLVASAVGMPARAATIRGTVFGPGDQPLAGAALCLSAPGGAERIATSDAKGRYEFADVPPGRYTLAARKPGFAGQRQQVSVDGAAQVLGVSFRLKPWQGAGWSITGTVRRADTTKPLKGCVVNLARLSLPEHWDDVDDATTDEAGFFAFTELAPGSYRVSALAPGFMETDPVEVPLWEGSSRRTLALVLAPVAGAMPPATVTGVARAADGRLLANEMIQVSLYGDAAPASGAWGDGVLAAGRLGGRVTGASPDQAGRRNIYGYITTDAEGRYRLTVPPGHYRLDINPYTSWLFGEQATVVLPPGKTLDRGVSAFQPIQVAKPAPPDSHLRGQILRPDGTPLAATGVYTYLGWTEGAQFPGGGYGHSWSYAVTDAAGRFDVGMLRARGALVSVKTRGFVETDLQRLAIPRDGLVFRLDRPSLRWSGRVVSVGGKPVRGAQVLAYRVEGRGNEGKSFAEYARFRYRGAGPPEAGPWPAETPVEKLRPGVVPGLLEHGLCCACSDDQGRFTLVELDGGTYHFRVTAPGFAAVERMGALLKEGEAPPDLTFTLSPLGSLDGIVVQPDGTALCGCGVVAWFDGLPEDPPEWARRGAVTDAAGRFHIGGLSPGRGRMRLVVSGYPPLHWRDVTINPGAVTTARFVLQPGCELRGQVIEPWAVVRWRPAGVPPCDEVAAMADGDGRFLLRGLPPGPGVVAAGADREALVSQRLSLPCPAGTALQFHGQRVEQVIVRVRDEQGMPVGGAVVEGRYGTLGPDEVLGAQPTNADGQTILQDVPRGPLVITVRAGAGWLPAVRQDDLTLNGGGIADLVLRRAHP